jgi:hypothetical protein
MPGQAVRFRHPPRLRRHQQHIRTAPASIGYLPQSHQWLPLCRGATAYAAICSVIETGMLRGKTAFAAIRTCLAGASALAAH